MRIGPLFAVVLILFSLGCISHRPPSSQWVNITDDRGNTVMVPVPVRRVVSLAPGETEILAAVGGADLLVGRCTACTWPPEVLQVPEVGGSQTFAVGQVEALDPDLVLATPHVNGTRLENLRNRGYAVLVFAPENIDGIYRNIRVMGEAIGEQRNAFIINEDLKKQETAFREQTGDLPRVRVIYVMLDDPLYVAGNQTYENSLISGAGGLNLMGGADGYLTAAGESLVRLDPDVILVPADRPDGSSTVGDRISSDPAFAGLSAVRNHRICAIDPAITHWPSPRVVQGLQLVSDCLRPGG